MLKRMLRNLNVGRDLSPVVLLAMVAILANCSRSATPKSEVGAGGEEAPAPAANAPAEAAAAGPVADKSSAIIFPAAPSVPGSATAAVEAVDAHSALVDSGDFKVVLRPQSLRLVSPSGAIDDAKIKDIRFSLDYVINRTSDNQDVTVATLTGLLTRQSEKTFATDFLTINGGRQIKLNLELSNGSSGTVTAQIRKSVNAESNELSSIQFPFAAGSVQFAGNIAFTVAEGANPKIVSLAINSIQLKRDSIDRLAFAIPYTIYQLGTNAIVEQKVLTGPMRRSQQAVGETYVSTTRGITEGDSILSSVLLRFVVVVQMPTNDSEQMQIRIERLDRNVDQSVQVAFQQPPLVSTINQDGALIIDGKRYIRFLPALTGLKATDKADEYEVSIPYMLYKVDNNEYIPTSAQVRARENLAKKLAEINTLQSEETAKVAREAQAKNAEEMLALIRQRHISDQHRVQEIGVQLQAPAVDSRRDRQRRDNLRQELAMKEARIANFDKELEETRAANLQLLAQRYEESKARQLANLRADAAKLARDAAAEENKHRVIQTNLVSREGLASVLRSRDITIEDTWTNVSLSLLLPEDFDASKAAKIEIVAKQVKEIAGQQTFEIGLAQANFNACGGSSPMNGINSNQALDASINWDSVSINQIASGENAGKLTLTMLRNFPEGHRSIVGRGRGYDWGDFCTRDQDREYQVLQNTILTQTRADGGSYQFRNCGGNLTVSVRPTFSDVAVTMSAEVVVRYRQDACHMFFARRLIEK